MGKQLLKDVRQLRYRRHDYTLNQHNTTLNNILDQSDVGLYKCPFRFHMNFISILDSVYYVTII